MEISIGAFIITLIMAVIGCYASIYSITELSIEKKQRETEIESLAEEVARLRRMIAKHKKDSSSLR